MKNHHRVSIIHASWKTFHFQAIRLMDFFAFLFLSFHLMLQMFIRRNKGICWHYDPFDGPAKGLEDEVGLRLGTGVIIRYLRLWFS